MRISLGFFLIVASCSAYAQTTSQPFTLTLSTFRPEFRAGQQVLVHVVMTNTSQHDVDCTSWFRNGLDRNYIYDVTYEDGKPAKDVDKHWKDSESSRCVLKPGESDVGSGGVISRIFDMSRPGRYTVQVTRHIWGDENRPETIGSDWNDFGRYHQPDVKSNIITITVLPADLTPPVEK
jgi:hypothetical protein